MAYEKTPLEWQNAGTEPAEDLKASGFLAGMKPAADTFNYFWNNTSECIKELQATIGDTTNLTTTNKASIVDAVNDGLNTKVDKVEGKGLSTNDYTTEEKEKLASISGSGASATTYVTTLKRDSWEGDTAPYTQTATATYVSGAESAEGILATDNAIVDVILGGTAEMALDHQEAWSCISQVTTVNGGIKATCYGDKPAVALSVLIQVVR